MHKLSTKTYNLPEPQRLVYNTDPKGTAGTK